MLVAAIRPPVEVEDQKVSDQLNVTGTTYRITVAGVLDESWLHYFDTIKLTEAGEQSVLVVNVPDQAALRGILEYVWDLNLVLLSVMRLGESPPANNCARGRGASG